MSIHKVSADPMDRVHLPVDEWQLVESRPGAQLGFLETIFATANGYLGMRGTPEEGRDVASHGTFLNGFHETWPIKHAENAFGFAKTGQTIVNAPDSTVIKLYVDDEPLNVSTSDLLEYKRWIDFREGVLRRDLLWRTPSGAQVRVRSSRMVSFTDRHLALMSLEVEMVKGSAPIAISSQIINRQDLNVDAAPATAPRAGENKYDPRQTTSFDTRVLIPEDNHASGDRVLMGYRTAHSGIGVGVAADHTVETEIDFQSLVKIDDDMGRFIMRGELPEGEKFLVKKAVAYHFAPGVPVRELQDRCRRTLDRVHKYTLEHYHDAQREFLESFWERSDIRIEGQSAVQQAARWCIYQLAQAAARADQAGVPAKGMTGSGYEGHYFWDTDIYVVPFLTFTSPEWARNALRFRVNLLDAARERARELNQRGALFPWRTINGDEASAYYAAGTAQYHIDADIAWAFATYNDITGDTSFLDLQGAEVLAETARMWADLGFWRTNGERTFHIHGVTGPDEYTTVVNNNLFTNVMAKYNLERAARTLLDLRERLPEAYRALVQKIDLDEREIDEWQACAEGMYIEFDETMGIHPQDDRFLDREVWDIKSTPADRFPLLLNYHPLVIYRFQVIKQADVVLATYLRGAEFTTEHKKANFEYYDPITTGDSTLSAVVQSIMAAEVGHQDLALDYFLTGLYVDLADLHKNTKDGVHIASAGGVWNGLVAGFGGMRFNDGEISFDPRLPEEWPALEFPLTVRGSRFTVRITKGDITFTLDEGEELEVSVRGETVRITNESVRVPLHGQGPILQDGDIEAHYVGDSRADGTLITSTVPDPNSPWEYPEAACEEHEG